MPVDVKATAGSAANLRLLQQGFLQLAIVQSDTLQDAANGQGDFAETGPLDGYSAVAWLYTEVCQLVVLPIRNHHGGGGAGQGAGYSSDFPG